MKNSILYEKQNSMGAVFEEYYDWHLPKYYSAISEEYSTARNNVALMDRSYYGIINVFGNDHVDLLHRLTTNELRNLKSGEGQISIFTNEKGRIVDRVIMYKFEDEMRLISSPQNSEKIAAWIDKYIFIEDVKVENLTSTVRMLTLFGPKSLSLLNSMFNEEFGELPNHHFKEIQWNGHSLQLSRTEELGCPGFNLILSSNVLTELWDQILNVGSVFDLRPMGEEAYEILRIEAGWPLYEKDFNEEINPHEAQLLPYVSFTKGCYIGQEVVARLDTYEKVQKYLRGIILEGDVKTRGKDVILINGQEVGYLTSVTHSIALEKNIALGYIRTKFSSEGTEVLINSENKQIAGKIVKLPFKV
ncbi:MAG: aminomethyltransferase family protein [bacterium]